MGYHAGKLSNRMEVDVLTNLVDTVESLINLFMDEYNSPDDDEAVTRAVRYLSDIYGPWVEDFYDAVVFQRKNANSNNW